MVIVASHVDDLLYAARPGYEWIVGSLLKSFEVKETKEGKFRFCGREFVQHDDFSIKVPTKGNTETTKPASYTKRARTSESKATEGEISQLRSVNGSLSYNRL